MNHLLPQGYRIASAAGLPVLSLVCVQRCSQRLNHEDWASALVERVATASRAIAPVRLRADDHQLLLLPERLSGSAAGAGGSRASAGAGHLPEWSGSGIDRARASAFARPAAVEKLRDKSPDGVIRRPDCLPGPVAQGCRRGHFFVCSSRDAGCEGSTRNLPSRQNHSYKDAKGTGL
jgi:hypothetical protein